MTAQACYKFCEALDRFFTTMENAWEVQVEVDTVNHTSTPAVTSALAAGGDATPRHPPKPLWSDRLMFLTHLPRSWFDVLS